MQTYTYNPKSLKAEEFIHDGEIQDTLAYAEANKNNIELIDEIIAKAKLRKGLSHREASVLLACEIPEKIAEIYKSRCPFLVPSCRLSALLPCAWICPSPIHTTAFRYCGISVP